MMYAKPFYLLSVILILLGACGPSKEELAHAAEENAWAEMMKIHDEVMPKTSEIVGLYTVLKKSDTQKMKTNELSNEVLKSILALEDAEEAMFAWMNELKNLNVLRPQKNHEEIMKYLKQETHKIVSIRNQMLTALEEGNKVLNKLSS